MLSWSWTYEHLRLLARLETRYPVLVIDEVGYLPSVAETANLFVQLIVAAAMSDHRPTRLLDDSLRTGVWPDSVQVIGGQLSMRLPTG